MTLGLELGKASKSLEGWNFQPPDRQGRDGG